MWAALHSAPDELSAHTPVRSPCARNASEGLLLLHYAQLEGPFCGACPAGDAACAARHLIMMVRSCFLGAGASQPASLVAAGSTTIRRRLPSTCVW